MKYLILLSLTIYFCISCNDLATINDYNDDGSLYRRYNVDKDSLIQGKYFIYYEDGEKIFEEAQYVDGQLHGERILYYDTGIPEVQEFYENDILVDTLRVFYPSGGIKRKANYEKGVLTGIVLSYFEDGVLKEEATFENNIENGPFTEYHPNGRPKWQGQFHNGDKEVGELLEYNDTGELIRRMMCDSNAICTTVWTLEKGDL